MEPSTTLLSFTLLLFFSLKINSLIKSHITSIIIINIKQTLNKIDQIRNFFNKIMIIDFFHWCTFPVDIIDAVRNTYT